MKNSHLVAVVAGGALVAYAAYKLTRNGVGGAARNIGGAAVDAVTGLLGGAYDALPNAIKPTSNENVFFKASNWPGQVISGDPDWSIGGWLYDILSPDEPQALDPKWELAKQNAALYGGTVAGWYGVDYIDNDPVNMRGTSAPIASKWGTATSVGWPWER